MLTLKPKEFHLPFLKKVQESKDAYSFYFDRSKTELEFIAGQYNRIFIEHPTPDERGTQRLFSISSSPLDTDYFMITTRIIQSSFKKALVNLQAGTMVKFFGPMGRFVLDETDLSPRVLLAGGIGMTPMHSMIKYVAQKKLQFPVFLFASFSAKDELVYYDEMKQIGEENQNVKIVYTITHEDAAGESWNGEVGRISTEMLQKYNLPDNALWYMSGPPVMVEAMKEIVVRMQISQERIKTEQFTGY